VTYRIGFVGTGNPDGDGFAMAYRHAAGYQRLDGCEVVACADLDADNARRFAAEHGIPETHVYGDHETMVKSAEPDIVSVAVPPPVHADVVVDIARSGVTDAVHCEKPMALTWAGARRMAEVCERAGVQLTVNHQLRFGRPYRETKRLLDSGAVGDPVRIEFHEQNLYDSGTHAFDLANFYVDQTPVEWALGQIDYSTENVLFGTHNENQGLAQWRYENGVYGIASTGRGESFVDAYLRVEGTDGTLEVGDDGTLRYRRDGRGWEKVETGPDGRYFPDPSTPKRVTEALTRKVSDRLADRLHTPAYTERAVEDVVTSLREGTTPELAAEKALDAAELIFATWESARRRGRVEFPLEVDDNPLEAMVESGDLHPEPAESPSP
jgi:predicted dehydrogenase